jgi:hypothetical protein
MTPTHAGGATSWRDKIEAPGAINVMALQVIAKAVEDHAGLIWGDYPDIGEHDWQRIIARARELARPPAPAQRDRALTLLTGHPQDHA